MSAGRLRPMSRVLHIAGLLTLVMACLTCRGKFHSAASSASESNSPHASTNTPRFDGQRAYQYLLELCALGPRPSGSPGMEAQQRLLTKHFTDLGARVHLQRFRTGHPVDHSSVPMANIIVEWFPERKDRVLLCAHYDTLPYPMLDPENPRGVFIGANDGASGVAVLMELGHHVAKIPVRLGVDFGFFDAEEFIFRESDPYFLGSEFFARSYRDKQLPFEARYRWAVLLDMVGDRDLQIYQERNSLSWPESRPLVYQLWNIARRLNVKEFIPRPKYDIRDDHIMLRNIGGIPSCVIIDFDYPYWHTQQDLPDKCAPESLAKVGLVLIEWLKEVK